MAIWTCRDDLALANGFVIGHVVAGGPRIRPSPCRRSIEVEPASNRVWPFSRWVIDDLDQPRGTDGRLQPKRASIGILSAGGQGDLEFAAGEQRIVGHKSAIVWNRRKKSFQFWTQKVWYLLGSYPCQRGLGRLLRNPLAPEAKKSWPKLYYYGTPNRHAECRQVQMSLSLTCHHPCTVSHFTESHQIQVNSLPKSWMPTRSRSSTRCAGPWA